MNPILPVGLAPTPQVAPHPAPSPAGAAPATPALQGPNPSLRIDPSLGMVVLEFRDAASGEVSRTVPTEHELRAYHLAQRTGQPMEVADRIAG